MARKKSATVKVRERGKSIEDESAAIGEARRNLRTHASPFCTREVTYVEAGRWRRAALASDESRQHRGTLLRWIAWQIHRSTPGWFQESAVSHCSLLMVHCSQRGVGDWCPGGSGLCDEGRQPMALFAWKSVAQGGREATHTVYSAVLYRSHGALPTGE